MIASIISCDDCVSLPLEYKREPALADRLTHLSYAYSINLNAMIPEMVFRDLQA